MKKIIEPCGLHCIKMNHLGVTIGNQTILEDVNKHIHCGTLNAVIGRNGAYRLAVHLWWLYTRACNVLEDLFPWQASLSQIR